MKELYQKAEIAEEILKSLNERHRAEIVEIVEKIKSLEREMDAMLIQFDVAEKCAKCEIPCCAAEIEKNFEEHYLFFLLFDISDEVKFNIWQALYKENDSEMCRFLAKNGCILPSDARAYICKRFFCPRFGPVQKIADVFSGRLSKLFGQLKATIEKHIP